MQNSHSQTIDGKALRQLVFVLLGLAAVALLLLAILRGGGDPATNLRIFSTRFLGIFIEAVPFLLLGSFVSGLIEVYVRREDIIRLIPKNPVLAPFVGSFLGFAFPVCECGVVPVTRRLFTKGLPMSVGVAFLLAAPVVNPIVLVSTYAAFENLAPEMVAWRFGITILVTVSVGIVFALNARPQEVLRPVSMSPAMGGSGDDLPPQLKKTPGLQLKARNRPRGVRAFGLQIYEALRIGSNEFFEMGRFLIIGCALAAGMQTLISQDTLTSIGEGPLLSVIVMQALAFVLSVCSTVDSFLALAFYGPFTGGSVLAFLTFGPMVDIKSTLMFAGVFKPKIVATLILLPLLMTMLVGVWVNLYTTL